MKGLLSIGKVSKLKNVSIKSLRYYDEIGILKPAFINTETGYRYYLANQLFIIDAISLCLELGIPLKDLDSYLDRHGKLDLQRLLCDGKILAEDKIRKMGNCLEKIQLTLKNFEQDSVSRLKSEIYTKKMDARQVLCVPFDETTSSDHYGHKLLELFVTAQKNGLQAAYPSGILYQYKKNTLQKYVFIHITGTCNTIDNILVIPKGNYFCIQNETHQIDIANSIFQEFCANKDTYCYIETDMINNQTSKKQNLIELQFLF